MSISIDKKSLLIGIVFILMAIGVMYFCTTQVYKEQGNSEVASGPTSVQEP